jgi:hypothetical protein
MKALLTTAILAATVHAFGAADAKANSFGSSTYRGVTTTVTGNGNGTRTVTRTDVYGGRSSQVVGGPRAPGIYVPDGKGGEKLYTPPAKSNVIGSSTYDGATTVVARNGDGTHTVTKTDANGNKSSEVNAAHAPGIYVPDGKGGEKLYTPPAKDNIIGSSTYKGVTTTVTGNGDGTRAVTKTDANGGKSSQVVGGPRAPGIYVPDGNGGEKLYTPPARSNVIGSSTYNGVTTVVTDNGDGSHTVTTTDADGHSTSEVHQRGG